MSETLRRVSVANNAAADAQHAFRANKQPLHSKEKNHFSRVARFLLSYGVAAACLYWVFHNLNFHELLHSFRGVNWWLVPPAVVLDLLVYIIAGWEWQILLRPVGKLSVRQTTQAVFAGRFANDVLPVHVGYVVRIYLVSHWLRARRFRRAVAHG